MTETVLKIDGMACGMCESHVNDAIRKAFNVQKVTSSHTKGETVILSEQPIGEAALRQVLDPTGYRIIGYQSGMAQAKPGLLQKLFGKK